MTHDTWKMAYGQKVPWAKRLILLSKFKILLFIEYLDKWNIVGQ